MKLLLLQGWLCFILDRKVSLTWCLMQIKFDARHKKHHHGDFSNGKVRVNSIWWIHALETCSTNWNYAVLMVNDITLFKFELWVCKILNPCSTAKFIIATQNGFNRRTTHVFLRLLSLANTYNFKFPVPCDFGNQPWKEYETLITMT